MLPHKMWTDNMSSAEVLVTLIAQHGTRTGAKILEPEIKKNILKTSRRTKSSFTLHCLEYFCPVPGDFCTHCD